MADEKQLVVNLALKAGTMKQQINSINKDIKQLQTDFKNAGAGVENFEKTSEGLSSKLKLQQSVIEKLKDKLNVYKREQEKCTATLDKAVSTYRKQEQKVKSLERALEEAKSTYGENSKEVKKLEEELKKANKTLETKRNSVINANNALTNMNTTISSTEAEMKGMERQTKQTANAFDKLEDEVDETSVEVKKLEKDFDSFGDKVKEVAGSAVKNLAKITAGAISAGVGVATTLTKMSIEQYGRYEQLVGGVETLFKDSSDKVMEYANNAYKDVQISANEYMDIVTSFSASLLQGLGGDTEKAVGIANMAVQDMADNANKFGTDIGRVQQAYQGFSRNYYTMLDVLKLGYAGTKSEMERLLADAEKLTGLKYRIENFNDVIEAIHVIQNELGVTGTTALEASTTIEGSFNMTKSAWENLVTGMADDEANFDTLINNLVDSASTFGEIIIPRVEIVIKGIGQLVEKLLPPIVERLPQLITDVLPDIIDAGIKMAEGLVNGIGSVLPQISQFLPQMLDVAVQIVEILGKTLIDLAPMLLEAGLQLILTLGQGISTGLPEMIPTIVDLIVSMCNMIIDNLPMFIDVALDIIVALAEGLIKALPTLIEEVPRIINSFCNAIYDKLPDILKAGIEIIIMLIKGLIDSIPTLVANIPQIIMAIVNVITMYNWASIGKNLIANIGSGISSMVTNISSIAKNLATNVINGIKGIFTANGGSIGRNLISFITSGISSMLGGIVSVASSVASSVVNIFRNMFSMGTMADIGRNLVKGIWYGISNMTGWIINLIGGFAGSVISSIKSFFGIGKGSGRSIDSPSGRSSLRTLYLNEPESLLNTRTFSLDNIALSGSYYNANTRDSLNANDVIRQVNGASQTLVFDGMMNSMVSILSDMNKAIQELKNNNGIEQTVIINSPKSLSPSEIARENKRALREMALQF